MCVDQDESQKMAADAHRAYEKERPQSYYRPGRFDGGILGSTTRGIDLAQIGPGGAPTRATTLDDTPAGRKRQPVASGVLDYFPDALVAVAEVSFAGNEQHNPGMSLRWTRGKSADEGDALVRHFLQRGGKDTDGIRHSAKLAWRALALLQKEIEGVQ